MCTSSYTSYVVVFFFNEKSIDRIDNQYVNVDKR
jgi:hypothetical protein